MNLQMSSIMQRLYILWCLTCVCRAQIPSFGFCPDYLPMANFQLDLFLGKWYEAERYFQFSEVASRCVVTDYAVGPNGKIYVSNEVTNRFTGVRRVIGGSIDQSGVKKSEGRLAVKYDTTPISTTSTLTILDTDYDNYAVIWSCSGFGPMNAQSAWLMTRERIPDATTLQKAYGVLDRYKINRTFFVKTDQEGCAIAASDLNAALGIASTSTNVEQTAEIYKKLQVRAQPVAAVLLEKNDVDRKEIVDEMDTVDNIETGTEADPQSSSLEANNASSERIKSKIIETATQTLKIPESSSPESSVRRD